MPFPVQALRVLVASPTDTADARRGLLDAINEWNDLNAEGLASVLIPTLWEISATPELGDRPQAIINRQLVDMCDVLVGMFWTRLGTPTGVSMSGTAEEIERFAARGGKVLLYFSNQPVIPGNLDPEQHLALTRYRTELQQRGLYGEYETVPELVHKVQRDLRRVVAKIMEDLPYVVGDPKAETTKGRVFEDAEYLRSQLRRIAAQSEPMLRPLIDASDVDGVRRVMNSVGFNLALLMGTLGAASGAAEASELGQKLGALAEEASQLERFQVYVDGGRSWKELAKRAIGVLVEVRNLAVSDWDSTFG
jgi:hypothetical protein